MFKNWASDNKVTKFLSWNTHKSVDDTNKVISMWIDEYNDESNYNWVIESKELNEVIGGIGISKVACTTKALLEKLKYVTMNSMI